MIMSIGGMRIEVTYTQKGESSDEIERVHKRNALEQAIREARRVEEIKANAHLGGLSLR